MLGDWSSDVCSSDLLHCTHHYNQLSAQLRREIHRAKNQIITETYKSIEAYADKNQTGELF